MVRIPKFEVAKIRKKGELTVPKIVREKLGWDEGDHIMIRFDDHKLILERIEE